MGKQSARLYYRGKDHKDIYFQEKYHNAMIVCKEGNEKLVWRKLHDEGYFVYTRWEYVRSYSYYTAILYPEYRIREYCSENTQATYHSDKYLARKYSYSSVGAVVSADGKLWRRIIGNDKEISVIPKGDGIVIVSSEGSSRYKYTYYPILKSGYPDEENSLMIYSDTDAGTKRSIIYHTTGITDAYLLFDESRSPYKAFAVDMKGNIYDGLFTIAITDKIGGSGCYNGMYYCVFTSVRSGCYVYVSNSSIGGPWERRSFPVTATDVYTIQSDDGIVVYIGKVNNSMYSTVQIYTTTDFINYTRVDIPTSISVPIIGPIYDGEKNYLNYMMAYGAPEMANAYNYGVHYNIREYVGDMSNNQICYIEKGKISPPKGMIFQHSITLTSSRRAQITVYLDNLFFQPSEGNFAFFEELYPITYMTDYLEKEGE